MIRPSCFAVIKSMACSSSMFKRGLSVCIVEVLATFALTLSALLLRSSK